MCELLFRFGPRPARLGEKSHEPEDLEKMSLLKENSCPA